MLNTRGSPVLLGELGFLRVRAGNRAARMVLVRFPTL